MINDRDYGKRSELRLTIMIMINYHDYNLVPRAYWLLGARRDISPGASQTGTPQIWVFAGSKF